MHLKNYFFLKIQPFKILDSYPITAFHKKYLKKDIPDL